jgi:hypothetical protein
MKWQRADSGLLLPDRELEVPRRLRPLSMAAPQQALLGGGAASTFANVSLQMHMEGGSLVDSSTNAHTLTVSGATQDTGWAYFGSKSLLISTVGGNQNRVTAANHAAFDMGTGEFTIRFALRIATVQTAILINKASGTGSSPFVVFISTNKLVFRITNQASGTVDITSTTTLAANTDYWVCCRRRNDTSNMVTELAINGTIEATSPTQLLTFDLFDNTGPLVIGNYNSGATFPLLGRMDEIRIAKMLETVAVPGSAFADS